LSSRSVRDGRQSPGLDTNSAGFGEAIGPEQNVFVHVGDSLLSLRVVFFSLLRPSKCDLSYKLVIAHGHDRFRLQVAVKFRRRGEGIEVCGAYLKGSPVFTTSSVNPPRDHQKQEWNT
jgi:hypothetical protein